MNRDLGIIITHINNSDWFDNIFLELKNMIKDNPYKHICIFNSYSEKIITHNVPILHLNQSKFFTGDVIVFDILSLNLIRSFPLLTNKYYYAQDVPWGSNLGAYAEWTSLLEQNKLEVIAKNQEVYDLYEICWKKPLGIMENFQYERLSQIVR